MVEMPGVVFDKMKCLVCHTRRILETPREAGCAALFRKRLRATWVTAVQARQDGNVVSRIFPAQITSFEHGRILRV